MNIRAAAIILYVLFSSVVFVYSVVSPIFNWDVLGYVAVALSSRTENPEVIHRRAYREVQQAVPPATYVLLGPRSSDPYNAVLSKDAAAFVEAVPFYRTRVLYLALVSALHALGLNIVFSTHLVSAVSVMASTWILLAIAWRRVDPEFILCLPFLAVAFGWLEVSRLSTPDGLALLGVLVSGLLYLKRSPLILVVLPLLVLIRTDLVLFAVPLGLCLAAAGRVSKIATAGSLVATIGSYWMVNQWAQHPGWQAVFHHSLVERLVFPLSQPRGLTPGMYFEALWRGLSSILTTPSMLTFTALAVWAAALLAGRGSTGQLRNDQRQDVVLLAVTSAFVVLHFGLFPVTWPRFFVGPYLLCAIIVGSLIARDRGGRQGVGPAPGNVATTR